MDGGAASKIMLGVAISLAVFLSTDLPRPAPLSAVTFWSGLGTGEPTMQYIRVSWLKAIVSSVVSFVSYI